MGFASLYSLQRDFLTSSLCLGWPEGYGSLCHPARGMGVGMVAGPTPQSPQDAPCPSAGRAGDRSLLSAVVQLGAAPVGQPRESQLPRSRMEMALGSAGAGENGIPAGK